MNIFKILAQGDGTINEPNVSAFLGYLLDPNEDHGLGSKFLENFIQLHYNYEKFTDKNDEYIAIDNKPNLSWLVSNNNNDEVDAVIDLSKNGDYEVKVFFEQAFAGDNGKQIVDIMLIVHKMPKGDKKEQYFKNYITNKKELKHIFLIEVKIADSAAHATDIKKNNEGQLIQQVINSRKVLEHLLKGSKNNFDINNDISIILVTPDILDKSKLKSKEITNAKTAFKEILDDKRDFKNNPKSLIYWNSIKDNDGNIINEDSVEKLIDNIIYSVHEYKAEPIPQYTIDTLKSFSNFIYSDFSYKYKRLPGNNLPDIFTYDQYDEFKSKYNSRLNQNSWDRIEKIKDELIKIESDNIKIVYSKTHPISMSYTKYRKGEKGNKIFGFTYDNKNLFMHFLIKKNYELKTDFTSIIEKKLQNYNTNIDKTSGEYGIKIFKIEDVPNDIIVELIQKQIEIINKEFGNK